MNIIIDVDDTVADLLPVWLDFYNRDFDDSLTCEDVTEWELTKFIKPECGEKIYAYMQHPNLYDDVRPIKNALYGVQLLSSRGHNVLFVTAAYHPGKLTWLKEQGFIMPANDWSGFIVSKDKSLIRADVIVDDYPKTIAHFPGRGIVFTRPHNQSFDWPYRANTWHDVIQLVDEFEKENLAAVVPGMGKDVVKEVNADGGKQSKLDYRFDLIDPLPLFRMAAILGEGAAAYGEWNWRRIPLEDQLNHAISHIYAHLAGDQQDDHLGHAMCRIMFALSLHITP